MKTRIYKGILLLLAMFITGVKLQSQSLKTFSGELGQGKITFTYYVDSKTGDEIKHGVFKYIENTSNSESSYSATFTGNYKNGYRDGIWSYTISNRDVPIGAEYQTGTIKMTLSYKDGMPNGTWNYSKNIKVRKKLYSRNGWSWGNYEIFPPETINVNFRNGILSGKLEVKTRFEDVTGQLNDDGFWTGKWIIKNGSSEQDEFELENGILRKFVTRKNGSIIQNSNYDPDLIQLQNQIINNNFTKEELYDFCRKHRLKLDTISGLSRYVSLKDGYFDNYVFKHQDIDGDKTYIAIDEHGNRSDRKNYGKYIVVERRELKPLSSIYEYRNAKTSEDFQFVLNKYELDISDEDKNVLLEKIKELSEKERLFKSNNEAYYEINSLISEIQILKKLPEIKHPEKMISKIWLDYFSKKIMEQYRSLERKYKSISSKRPSFPQYFNSEYNYVSALDSVKKEKIQINELASVKDSIIKFNELCINADMMIQKVYRTYVSSSTTGNAYTSSTANIAKKKLYNTYEEILQNKSDEILQKRSLEELTKTVQEISLLCEKMIDLRNADTKDLEKQLKKAKTPEEKYRFIIE